MDDTTFSSTVTDADLTRCNTNLMATTVLLIESSNNKQYQRQIRDTFLVVIQ